MDKDDKKTPADDDQIELTIIPTDEEADSASEQATKSEPEAEKAEEVIKETIEKNSDQGECNDGIIVTY